MPLLAVRLIDLAIFGSLGALWIGGATFIVLLYRWILRLERGDESQPTARNRVPSRVTPPQAATTREGYAPKALVSHS